jgi:hypothetical protein
MTPPISTKIWLFWIIMIIYDYCIQFLGWFVGFINTVDHIKSSIG